MSKKKEEAHDKLWYDLINASKTASKNLDVVHVIHLGIQYYASEAKQAAPNIKEAREMMLSVIDRVLEENE